MKGLSINNFWNLRPKLPFRFKADFYTGLDMINDKRLSYALTSINLPKMDGQASEGSVYLGNTIFTVPVWSVASRKLEISFEETDDMLISSFFDILNKKSYGKVPWHITVVVHEFEEHLRDDAVRSTAYVCHMSSYDEPSFKRDGAAAQVTMSATFIVDTVIKNWSRGKGTVIGTKLETTNKLNPELRTLQRSIQNEKFTFGDVNYGVSDELQTGVKNKSKAVLERQRAVKNAAQENRTSYLAMSIANGSDKNVQTDTQITDEEIARAKDIQQRLDSTLAGRNLQGFAEELSTKSYGWGKKGKDGDISKTAGIDCSGAVAAWAERQGYSMDECKAGATNGGLVKQLQAQGVKEISIDKLKVGDIVASERWGGGDIGHTMIFAGKEGDYLYFVDSSGSGGGGTVRYTDQQLEILGVKAYNVSERKK